MHVAYFCVYIYTDRYIQIRKTIHACTYQYVLVAARAAVDYAILGLRLNFLAHLFFRTGFPLWPLLGQLSEFALQCASLSTSRLIHFDVF